MDNSMILIVFEVVFMPFTSSPPFILAKENSPLLNPKICFIMEGSRKVGHFWCRFGSLPCCRILKWPVWLLFALLPLATACQILGTFEKFSELSSAKSARFSANRSASRIPTRWACASQPGFRPFALSFGLESPLIGLRLCFSV